MALKTWKTIEPHWKYSWWTAVGW